MLESTSAQACGPKSFQTIWIKPPAEAPTIDLAMIPERTSPFYITTVESLGFCKSPPFWRLIVSGITRLKIYLPVHKGLGFKMAG